MTATTQGGAGTPPGHLRVPGERGASALGTTLWGGRHTTRTKGEGTMTSRIPLIIGIALTALAFGIPTALGEDALSNEKTRSRVETPKAAPYKPGPVVEGSYAPHSTTAAAARGYLD